MNNIVSYSKSPFDAIRRLEKNGGEFWSARDLMRLLGYQKWEQFLELINLAIVSCKNLGNLTQNHFLEETNPLTSQDNFWLSCYGCYLVSVHGDHKEKAFIKAKDYFAVKIQQAQIKKIKQRMIELAREQVTLLEWLEFLEEEN
jgi:DNA-damage-inducible protein D